jgi:hypothetical protein
MLVFDEPHATVAAVRRLPSEGFDVAALEGELAHAADEAPDQGGERDAGGRQAQRFVRAVQRKGRVVDWPMNIGGKPDTALPALVPVTFELTVLVAAFATLGTLSLRRRLFPRLVPAPAPRQPHPRVTDDRFAVLVVERDGSFAPDRFRRLVEALGPVELVEDWRVA